MAVMDRRQEKIQATRHAEIVTLLADVRRRVFDLFTGDIGDVNVAAYVLDLQQKNEMLRALLSDVIKERNELLDDLESQVLHDTSDVEAALEEATRARLRNLLAWRVASLKLDNVTDHLRQLIAQHMLMNRDYEALKEAYDALAAREAQASSDLVECQLDLNEAHTALGRANVAASKKDELLQAALDNSKAAKAPLAQLLGCEPTLEAITAAIKSLKAALAKKPEGDPDRVLSPAPVAVGVVKSLKTSVPPPNFAKTTVAETVRELASRGHKAEGIHRIINQRSEPSAVINLAGIRAIYDMVVPK